MIDSPISVPELCRLPVSEQAAVLATCCGAPAFALLMAPALAARTPTSVGQVLALAEEVFDRFAHADWLEAFAHHPEIGDLESLERRHAPTAALSRREQGGVAAASRETLQALHDGNRAYQERFGFIFIVCASGKSATEMLALLQARLPNDRERELLIAAGEQRRITRVRLLALLRVADRGSPPAPLRTA